MPYEIRAADATDLPAWDNVMTAAFTNGGLRTYIYPHGRSHANRIHMYNKNYKIFNKLSDQSSGSVIMCAYDTSTPAPDCDFEFPEGFEVLPDCVVPAEERKERKKVVGFAWYKIESKPKTFEEIEKENEQEPPPPDANAALLEAFYGGLTQARLKYLPNLAHVNLNVLGTAPEVWGKGVGSMLLKWGLKTADDMGLPLWLEATKAGRPLYLKYGFEELGLVDFDSREFGSPEKMPYWYMLRPITGKKVDEKVDVDGVEGDSKEEGVVEATAETKLAGV